MSGLIKRDGSINPEGRGERRPGTTRIIFKPSAKPGNNGAFLIPADDLQKLGEAQARFEAANDPQVMAEALDMIIDIVVRHYNTVKPSDLPRGILVPRWLRFRWYKRGIYDVLTVLCADDQVEA